MIESGLRRKLSGLFKDHGIFSQSIESTTNPGMPDMFYQASVFVNGWLELKLLKNIPAKVETSLFRSMNHGLRDEQIVWILRCLAAGGRVAILAGYERRYFLVPGKFAEGFNHFTWAMLQEHEVTRDQLITYLKCGTISR